MSTCSPSCRAVPRQQLHQDTGCASSIDTSRFHHPSQNTCFHGRVSLLDGQRWLRSQPWLPPPSPPSAQTLPRSERVLFPAAPLAPLLMCRLCLWTAGNEHFMSPPWALEWKSRRFAPTAQGESARCSPGQLPPRSQGSWALPSSERPGRALGVFEQRNGVGRNTPFCRALLLPEYGPRSRLYGGNSWYRGLWGAGCAQ